MEDTISSRNQGGLSYEYKTTLSLSIPTSYMDRIRDFQQRYRIKQKNWAVMQLLDLGLFVESKLGLVQSIKNEELEELKEQIENGQIIDYVEKMDLSRFRVLVDIMKQEEQARFKSRK